MEEISGLTKNSEREQQLNKENIQKGYLSPENTKVFSFEKKNPFILSNLSANESMEIFDIFTTEKLRKSRTRTSRLEKNRKSFARSLSMKNIPKNKSKNKQKEKKNNFNAINAINEAKIRQLNEYSEESSSQSEEESSVELNFMIDKKMREMKDNMLSKIENMKKTLEKNYDDHIKKIKTSVMQKARRITQVINNNMRREMEKKKSKTCEEKFQENNQNFEKENETPKKEYEYMKKYTHKNLDEKMNQIFDIHSKIEYSIEKNFEILNNFLRNFDLSQKYPNEDFVNENADAILDSWIFSKINFEKLNMINFIENDKIPNNLKKFIYQDTFNKFSMISIKKSKNYEFDKNLMYENHIILEKLSLKTLEHEEFKKIFSSISQIEGLKFKKLKEILIEDCILESTNFNNLFPNTERILIKNSLIKLNFTNISKDFTKLKILSIKNSNLNNKNFDNLIEDFSNCKEILENLEILDLANNKLTGIDLSTLSNYNQKFYSLQIFILNKNKIQKFKPQNLNCLPNVKFLNLSSNNFTCPKDFLELKEKSKKFNHKILILMGNNFFNLNNKIQSNFYIQYLTSTLKDFDFFLRKLDFNKSFNNFNKNSLLEIHLNTNIQISLKKLNLSFCSLDSNTLFDFIKNNSGFINLRTLDVSENFIDDYFFTMYDQENLFNLMENLEVFKLRNNKISAKCITHFESILKKQKKLKKIFLSKNLIENKFVELMRSNEGIKKFNSCDNLKSCNKLLLSPEDGLREIAEELKCNDSGNEIEILKFQKLFDFLSNSKREDLKIYFSKKAETVCNKVLNGIINVNDSSNNRITSANVSFSNSFHSGNIPISNSNENSQEEFFKKKELILKKFIKFEN